MINAASTFDRLVPVECNWIAFKDGHKNASNEIKQHDCPCNGEEITEPPDGMKDSIVEQNKTSLDGHCRGELKNLDGQEKFEEADQVFWISRSTNNCSMTPKSSMMNFDPVASAEAPIEDLRTVRLDLYAED